MPKYKDDYVKELILDRKSKSESFMRPNWDAFAEIYSLYVCYTKSYSDILTGNRANVFVPYVFSKIETKLPRIIQATLSGDDWFQVIGAEEDYDNNAKMHDKLMKYQFEAEIDKIFFFMTWWKECMLYGNSFSGVFYEKEKKKVRGKVPRYIDKTGNNLYPHILGYDYKMKDKVTYDGISLIPFDIFDCLPAPKGNKVNGLRREAMDYFIIRSEPSISYLKSMVEDKELADMHGWNREAVLKFINSHPNGTGDLDRTRTERMGYRNMSSVGDDDYANPHYEMYTMWEDDCVISIIENEIVRNCGPDKFPFDEMSKPIVMALDTPVPHELFALGQIKPILRLQYYAQDLENAKLDSIFDLVYPGYFVNTDQIADGYLNILKQNFRGLHPCVGSPDTVVRPIQKQDKSLVATNEQINLERLLNMALGSGDILSGVSEKKDTTLGEIQTQVEQANYRFDLSVRLLKDFSVKELLLKIIDRNKQYSPKIKNIQLKNEEGELEREQIENEGLQGNFDVLVKTSPMMGNKLLYAQNLLRFLDILNKDQGQHPELVRVIGKSLGIEDAGDYIANPKQEVIAMIVQAAQEGLLENGQQAALILKAVLDKLAPAPQGGSIPGPLPGAVNQEGLARQTGQMRLV